MVRGLQADRWSKEVVGGHTLRGLRRWRGEGFGCAVLDCGRIQDGNEDTGTANIVMHVHTMLAVIGGLIVCSAVLTANLPPMIVAMVMVAMVNMAMFGMRVRVDNEAGKRPDRSDHSLADPRRDCEDKRKKPDQVSTASACSLQ